MSYFLYKIALNMILVVGSPFLLILSLVARRYTDGLGERLGFYSDGKF